ncbi:hypothetical protein [Burkholderia lata]|nr:hypothetical protein [Burkholderia lata]
MSIQPQFTLQQQDQRMKQYLYVATLAAAVALTACSHADDDDVPSTPANASSASAPAAAADSGTAAPGTSAAADDPAASEDAASASPASGASQ